MHRLFTQLATVLALVIAPMFAFASPLVSPAWLSEKLDDEKVVVIDLRNKIDKGSFETFLEGHIPGAIHSDYLKDGWRVGRDGVVGLLPKADQFQSLAAVWVCLMTPMLWWCLPAYRQLTLAVRHGLIGRLKCLVTTMYLFWMGALPHGVITPRAT